MERTTMARKLREIASDAMQWFRQGRYQEYWTRHRTRKPVEQVFADAKQRLHGRQAFVVAAVLGVLVAFLTTCGEQEPTTSQTTPGFAQPQTRRSAQGALRTTLHAHIAPNTLVDQSSGV